MFFIIFLMWLIENAIKLFWICDVLNMPFMYMFDTIYPLNEEFWLLFFICRSSLKINTEEEINESEEKT